MNTKTSFEVGMQPEPQNIDPTKPDVCGPTPMPPHKAVVNPSKTAAALNTAGSTSECVQSDAALDTITNL
jgi:hypothetical protein